MTAYAVGAGAHLRHAYIWMADDVDAQSDDDGGRWGEGTVGGVGRSVNVKVGGKCLYE